MSNLVVSLGEDGAVATVTLLAWQHPWVAAALAVVLLVSGAALAVFLVRRVRRGWARVRRWMEGPAGDAEPGDRAGPDLP